MVLYTYVPDMEQRRAPHRQDHLAWIRDLADKGTLLVAGAAQEPVDTGVLVVRAADAHEVRRLLLDDPYALANLITGVVVRPFGLVVGG
nr:YciI family protein [Planosporangium mesophilum]